jgi:CrcB protein
MIQIKTVLLEIGSVAGNLGEILLPATRKLMLVMVGGALGAASRYGVSLYSVKTWGTSFPWGTLAVNLAGCFLIGLIFSLSERMRVLTPEVRLFLVTGYLGALTTFSTFSLETVNAGRAGLMLQPLVNILINNVGGISLTFVGMWLGRIR